MIALPLTLRAAAVCLLALALGACQPGDTPPTTQVPGRPGAMKTVASARAQRRLFDGAPPVIPHQNFRIACTNCHNEQGMNVPPFGFAPPSPHERTQGMSAMSRCEQCHVFSQAKDVFADNTFDGLRQDLRKGPRLNPFAPPVLPHPVQMRENCNACHTGPAAREEIRCPHPERVGCTQCHVQPAAAGEFVRTP